MATNTVPRANRAAPGTTNPQNPIVRNQSNGVFGWTRGAHILFSGGSVELAMATVVLATISARDNGDDEVVFGVKLGSVGGRVVEVVVEVVDEVVVVVVVVVVGVVVVVVVDLGGQPRSHFRVL